MAKSSTRPGRTLLVFGIVVALLYVAVAFGGSWKPRLGLDLEGGTRITLVADGSPAADKLSQAATIISQRVNGNGVTEATVTTQGGSNVIVEIPGKNRQDLVDSVKRTAQLRFRVVAYCTQLNGSFCEAGGRPAPATPSPSASPSTKPSSSPAAAASSSAPVLPRPAPEFAAAATTPTGPKTSDYLAWSKNPDTAWQILFAVAKCDTKSPTALVPPIANTMDVANPPTSDALSSALANVKPESYVPAVDDAARPLISCDDSGNKFLLTTAPINGTDLASASYGTAQQSLGNWVVNLSFKSNARGTFAKLSQEMYPGGTTYAGGRFAIVLDGATLSTPGFTSPILDGNAQISGSFTEASAQSLANSLKYGALPVKFKPDASVLTVGPSLAGNQLSAGIIAGIVGLLIVMAYCLVYYRGLGLVVIASLLIAAGVTYVIVLLLAKGAGFTLTLPGIAGLIVAVGITADSFIVYFERIRDEMRDGKSMRVAVQAGWLRARNTCLAADAVSLLAAVVLYTFAIGVVRGFAFALGVSTLIDLVVFFWFTHPVIQLLSHRLFFNRGHRLSGLSRETLGLRASASTEGSNA